MHENNVIEISKPLPIQRVQSGARGAFLDGCCALVTVASLIYLGHGFLVPARLFGFIFGILFPGAALFCRLGFLRRLDLAARALIGLILTILAITPIFYLRRSTPVSPGVVDAALAVLTTWVAVVSRSYGKFIADLKNPLFRAAKPLLFLAIPILFALTWMGYEVTQGSQVVYYGSFPVDFANLASMVGLINASHGLPHWPVAGSEVANYHWLFFTFPAWLSSFGGGHSSNAVSLIVCNMVAACILVLTLCVVGDGALRMTSPSKAVPASTIAMAAGVISLASLIIYPYQAATTVLAHLTNIPSLEIAARNGLLLSVANSMAVFGNNTLAAALALLAIYTLLQWNSSLSPGILILGGIFLLAIIGYSVTLFFPTALAFGIWLLLGRVRRPVVVVVCTGIIGIAGIVLFKYGLKMLGSNKELGVQFDHGYYFRHVLFVFLPLWCLAWIGRRVSRGLSLFWVLIICSVIVPSFLYVPNTHTGQFAFSMKITALIAVAGMPLVSAGLQRCRENWFRPLPIFSGALIAVGLLCTMAYAGQFAYMRMLHSQNRAVILPGDYVEALKFIRDQTPTGAIVIDSESVDYARSTPTVSIGERRVYLPTNYADQILATAALHSQEMVQRKADYSLWSAGGFADPDLCRKFAQNADVLILRSELAVKEWMPMKTIGRYTIYKSVYGTLGRAWSAE